MTHTDIPLDIASRSSKTDQDTSKKPIGRLRLQAIQVVDYRDATVANPDQLFNASRTPGDRKTTLPPEFGSVSPFSFCFACHSPLSSSTASITRPLGLNAWS